MPLGVLAVVPSDPLSAYQAKGRGSLLGGYYNPAGCFERVVVLSPRETTAYWLQGMRVIPTMAAQLPQPRARGSGPGGLGMASTAGSAC